MESAERQTLTHTEIDKIVVSSYLKPIMLLLLLVKTSKMY